MNDINESPFTKDEDAELAAIFRKRNEEKRRLSEQQNAERERKQEMLNNQMFREIEYAVAEAIKRNEPPKIVVDPDEYMDKSIRRPKVPQYIIKDVTDSIEFLKENRKKIIAATLVLFVLSTPLRNSAKVNGQISDMTKGISNSLKDNDLAEKNGLLQRITLTVSPKEIVENLNISSTNHIRLYILSLSLSESDFNSILKELGYSGFNNYLNKLGYRKTETSTQAEQYKIEYSEKLREIINELNRNPDLRQEYLSKYPELKFIYNDENSYITESGNVFMVEQNAGRSH